MYTQIIVPRAIAVALLLCLACDAVCLGLFASGDAAVPACCRRDGKHQCMQQMPGAEGLLVKALPQRCPYFPKNATALGRHLPAPPPSLSAIPTVFSQPTPKVLTQIRYRVPLVRGWQERGPPSFA